MPAYLDSSALIKRYLREHGSREVDLLFREQSPLLVSAIAWAECLAAFSRKQRDRSLSVQGYRRVRRAFAGEWASLNEIGVTKPVQDRILDLLGRHPLRGMDAIHLASALWACETLRTELPFVCSDRRLADAAARVGLVVVNPEA